MYSGPRLLRSIVAVAMLGVAAAGLARAEEPVVRSLFFYMPTCEHCHLVMDEFLPPVMQRYDRQLLVAFVDASTPAGNELFYAACDHYGVPPEAQGVPLMVVGPDVMNGDVEIPQRLEEAVDRAIAAGGAEWPPIAGIEAIAAQEAELGSASAAAAGEPVDPSAPQSAGASTPLAEPVAQLSGASGAASQVPEVVLPSVRESWAADPTGFGIAIAAMALLLASVGRVIWVWMRRGLADGPPVGLQAWAIPVLCVVGVIVAAYLGYVESTNTRAVCGPVGDCNSVQESEFALLFGILPVGVLGLMGYVVILALWAWRRFGRDPWSERFRWLLPLVVLFGVVFSTYLTFLELFVIRAVCMWCVTSAVTMALLLWCVYKGWAEPSRQGSPATLSEEPAS